MIPIRKIVSNFFQTITRFPAPILSALLAFAFLIISIHFTKENGYYAKHFVFIKAGLACMSGISLFFAFDIFSETKQATFSKRLGLILLGFCVLGLHYYSVTPGMFAADGIFVSRYLIFLVCFHLMISFIAFYYQQEILSFWRYNYFLFRRFFISLAYSFTLFVGLSSALWAIGKLFGFDIMFDYYIDIAGFIFLVFNSIYFFSGIPINFDDFQAPNEFKQGSRIFVQYILLPIVFVYALILYIYMFKILLNHQLPIGWVCIPILLFSIIGILAYLLIYPIRKDTQHRMIYVFAKYFFYVLLPLLSLYFISIYYRIMPYGITEDRYLIVVLGIWLTVISVYIILSDVDNIIIIPVSLFLLLSISAIGPWGMFQLGIQNQLVRLERILKKNNLLDNNRLIVVKPETKIDKQEIENIQSILTYLNRRGEISRIKHWLKDSDQIALENAIKHKEPYSIHAIFNSMKIDGGDDHVKNYFITSDSGLHENGTLSVEGFKYMKQINAYDNSKDEFSNEAMQLNGYIDHQSLILIEKNDTLLKLPLEAFAMKMFNMQKAINAKNMNESSANLGISMIENESIDVIVPHDSLQINWEGKRLDVFRLQLHKADSVLKINELAAYLLY